MRKPLRGPVPLRENSLLSGSQSQSLEGRAAVGIVLLRDIGLLGDLLANKVVEEAGETLLIVGRSKLLLQLRVVGKASQENEHMQVETSTTLLLYRAKVAANMAKCATRGSAGSGKRIEAKDTGEEGGDEMVEKLSGRCGMRGHKTRSFTGAGKVGQDLVKVNGAVHKLRKYGTVQVSGIDGQEDGGSSPFE